MQMVPMQLQISFFLQICKNEKIAEMILPRDNIEIQRELRLCVVVMCYGICNYREIAISWRYMQI